MCTIYTDTTYLKNEDTANFLPRFLETFWHVKINCSRKYCKWWSWKLWTNFGTIIWKGCWCQKALKNSGRRLIVPAFLGHTVSSIYISITKSKTILNEIEPVPVPVPSCLEFYTCHPKVVSRSVNWCNCRTNIIPE